MRDTWRAARTVLGFGFRAAPWAAVLQLITGAVFELCGPIGVYGAKLLVDAAIDGDLRLGLIAAGVIAGAVGAFLVALFYYVDCVFTVIERTQALTDRHLMQLVGGSAGLAHHERPDYLDQVQRIREERHGLGNMVNAIAGLLRVTVVLIASSLLLAAVDPVLLGLVALGLVSFLLSRRARDLRVAAQEETSEPERLRRHLFDTATAAHTGKELRVFGLADELRTRHHRVADDVIKVRNKADRKSAVLESIDALVSAAAFIGAIALILMHALRGQATPGDVVLVIGLAGTVGGAVGIGVAYGGQFLWVLRIAKRLIWLQDHARAADAPPRTVAPSPETLRQGIELRNVSFSYPGTDRPVLDNISLRLPAGSVVALVGENGAGKTSLVKLLCSFYQPDTGQILIDGADLSHVPMLEWQRRVSGTFQDYAAFEFLVQETIGVADLPRVNDQEAVLTSLDRAGATDLLDILPNHLDTQLGTAWDDGIDLSGGQWQKLALARGLMREHPLLVVFDEPTAALDPRTEHALFERVTQAARLGRAHGTVTLLISHRFSTVTMADQIVVLHDGGILENGSHQQLLNNGGLYAELYQIQANAYQ